MTKKAVTLEEVYFSYEKNLVLRNLSFEISKQQICFIMGNNGSGKTTLIKNIVGFLEPQRGRIMVNGINVSTLNHNSISKLVSYVPQAIQLNTDFKVLDYLALGRTPHSGLLNRLHDSDYEIIDKYSLRFGIQEILDTEFNKLSGGQKQMVAIVRSLVQDTPIIVMDEPMSALDLGKQVDILKSLRQLVDEGKTIILTTHNPNHALAIDSEVCFLDHGEIVAFGRSHEIIKEEILHRIYGSNVSMNHGKYDPVVFCT